MITALQIIIIALLLCLFTQSLKFIILIYRKYYMKLDTEKIIIDYCKLNNKHISEDNIQLLIKQVQLDKNWHAIVYFIDKFKTKENIVNYAESIKKVDPLVEDTLELPLLYFAISDHYIISNLKTIDNIFMNYTKQLVKEYNKSVEINGLAYGLTELNKKAISTYTPKDIEIAKALQDRHIRYKQMEYTGQEVIKREF